MAMIAGGCCGALRQPVAPIGGTGTTPVSTNARV
jgi:hypothetical protein